MENNNESQNNTNNVTEHPNQSIEVVQDESSEVERIQDEVENREIGAAVVLSKELGDEVKNKEYASDSIEKNISPKSLVDQEKINALDKKYELGEEFTIDDLRFIYSIDHRIHYLEDNESDSRVEKFKNDREKHKIKLGEVYGDNANWITMGRLEILKNRESLLKHGANPTIIVNKLNSEDINYEFSTYLKAGADPTALAEGLNSRSVYYLDELISRGAEINVDELVNGLEDYEIVSGLDTLLDNGADATNIANKLDPYKTLDCLENLIEHGAKIDVNELAKKINSPYIIANRLESLIKYGAEINVNDLVEKMDFSHVTEIENVIDDVLSNGADATLVAEKLGYVRTAYFVEKLLSFGAKIDFNELVNELRPVDVEENIDTLLKHGSNATEIANKLGIGAVEYLDKLMSRGAKINVNELADSLKTHPTLVIENIRNLRKYGAKINVNELLNNMAPNEVASHLNELMANNAQINVSELIEKLLPGEINANINNIVRYGGDRRVIANKLRAIGVIYDYKVKKERPISRVGNTIESLTTPF